MKTAAIISEYNPFHTGHEFQINKIREEFGKETRIIAIMSGNYTQRGETAILDKNTRAEMAVRCGANLVLELPFPFSISSAPIFASSAVSIADKIKVVDYLSFGSECGNISLLSRISHNMLSEQYENKLSELLSSDNAKNIGYPAACEMAYNSLFEDKVSKDFFTSNNILAIEYIKALTTINSKINPHTIKRDGADYSDENISESKHQSATAIRKLMHENINSALDFIPKNAIQSVLLAFNSKKAPCDQEKLASAVISHFRLNSHLSNRDIHDAGGGLYNRLQSASNAANSITSLTELADTKKFTTARIRRAIWYSFFGVTSSEVKASPLYTRVLAMDGVGMAILKSIKEMSDFPIVTKPSASTFLSEAAAQQKARSDKADEIFELTKPEPSCGDYQLRQTPFIMK